VASGEAGSPSIISHQGAAPRASSHNPGRAGQLATPASSGSSSSNSNPFLLNLHKSPVGDWRRFHRGRNTRIPSDCRTMCRQQFTEAGRCSSCSLWPAVLPPPPHSLDRWQAQPAAQQAAIGMRARSHPPGAPWAKGPGSSAIKRAARHQTFVRAVAPQPVSSILQLLGFLVARQAAPGASARKPPVFFAMQVRWGPSALGEAQPIIGQAGRTASPLRRGLAGGIARIWA